MRRHVGTTRTAVAVLLFVLATLASSAAGESPTAEAVAATRRARPSRRADLGRRSDARFLLRQPAQRRPRAAESRSGRAQEGPHRRRQLRGDLRARRRLQVRQRQQGLLRLPGAPRQRADAAAGRRGHRQPRQQPRVRLRRARLALHARRAQRREGRARPARPARSWSSTAAGPRSPSWASRPTTGPTRWPTTPRSTSRSSARRARPTSWSPSCTPAPRARARCTSQGAEEAYGEYRGDSRHFARVAIDAGADVVLGSGPHVLRGLELYKGRLIAYSLGNLAGWHNFGTGGRSSLSALLTVDPGARRPLLRRADRLLPARRRRGPARRPEAGRRTG